MALSNLNVVMQASIKTFDPCAHLGVIQNANIYCCLFSLLGIKSGLEFTVLNYSQSHVNTVLTWSYLHYSRQRHIYLDKRQSR